MTLYQIINTLKQIALTQPNVKSATDGSVYDVMNANPSVKYNVVHFSQTTHQSDEEFDYYGLNIFYISRLEDSLEDNRLQIQSIGKEILDNIIRTFCENWNIEFPTITYYPFTQKFADLCAGAYCNVRLEVPKELICADDFIGEIIPSDKNIRLQDVSITITQNGLRVITPAAGYDGIGEITINTEVPQELDPNLEEKEVEYTQNGSYRVVPGPDYDGISSVSIDVDVPSRYDEGYADGEADQKAKLTALTINNQNVTKNFDPMQGVCNFTGTFNREDGYSGVSLNINAMDIYADGRNDGIDTQKALLSSTSFTQNSAYTNVNGWSAVTVDVPSDVNNQDKTFHLSTIELNPELIPVGGGHYLLTGSTTVTYDSGYTGLGTATIIPEISADEAIALGENNQKAKLSSISFRENQTYTNADGWSSVTVDVPTDYYDGVAAQKAKLTTLYVDENGTYTRADGYSSITVDVAQTGYTQQDLDDAYNRGYQEGLEACQQLPVTATSITINVANTVTDSATATTTVNPSAATTNLTYSSSDTSKATINGTTGKITVKANGSVTFCVRDSVSNLQSCKTVNVVKTESITAFTYTADTSTIPYSGANRTIKYSTSGFNTSSIGLIDNVESWTKSGTTYTLTFPYNYYGEQKTYYAKLTGYTTGGTYIETRINYTQEAYPYKGKFVVVYNVTSTTKPTQIMYDNFGCVNNCVENNQLESAKIVSNNRNVPVTSATFTFPSTGKVSVEYTLSGGILGGSAFWGCTSIVEVKSFSGVKIINKAAFKNCTSLSSVTLSNDILKLRSQAENGIFQNCSALSNVSIGTGIPTLTNMTFANCSSLKKITIPNNVTTIENFCFENCSGLTSMTFQATTLQTVPAIGNTSLGSTSYTFPLYVPANATSYYNTKWAGTGYESRITAIS